jgi:tripartite-type tricarboxylate transporter receptor subunit TctC
VSLSKASKYGPLLVAVCWMLPANAFADAWPSKPITIIVPYAAGGSTDLQTRALGEFMNRKYGYTVVVDNRPGAGGYLGTNAVQTASPNGYTFGYFSSATAIAYKFMGKDLVIGRDVEAVAQAQETSTVTVVNPKTNPSKTFAALIQYLKDNPGTGYTTIGVGSTNHMLMSAFARNKGLDVVHIPYKGGSPATAALVAGDVGVGSVDPQSVLSSIEAGRLVALASSGKQRMRALPNIQTVHEAGFPELGVTAFGGIIAPKGVPPEILARFAQLLEEATKDPGFVERVERGGSDISFADGKTFENALNAVAEKFGKIIVENNIKLE